MPPVRARRRQQQRQRVERQPRRLRATATNPTPAQDGIADAPDTGLCDQQAPGAASDIQNPVIQLSDDQIDTIVDKVTTQLASQISAPQKIQPIYDVNKRGNYVCIDDIEENDDCLINESIGNELGLNVSNKTKLKIVSDEYIDLASLLTVSTNLENSDRILQVKNGQILLEPKKTAGKIDTIDKWTDAFLVFMSIYVQAHPSSATSLIKYMSIVRLGAARTKSLGFKSYDEQFRVKKAKNPSLDWGTVDNELWLLYMYQTPIQSLNNDRLPKNVGKCFDYNFKAFCQKKPCNFAHKCLKCDGPHPSLKCFNKQIRTLNFRSGQGQRGEPKISADQGRNK